MILNVEQCSDEGYVNCMDFRLNDTITSGIFAECRLYHRSSKRGGLSGV